MTNVKGMEGRNSKTEACTKEIGRTMLLKAGASLRITMGLSTKASLKAACAMVTDVQPNRTVTLTKAIGRTIYSMDSVRRCGNPEEAIKAIIDKAKSMAKEPTFGKTKVGMKEAGMKTPSKARGCMCGVMVVVTMANGRII